MKNFRRIKLDGIEPGTLKYRIATRLNELEMPMATASELAGFGETAVRDVLRRPQLVPGIDLVVALAPVLDVSLEWLALGVGDPGQVDEPITGEVISFKKRMDEAIKGVPAEARQRVLDLGEFEKTRQQSD